MSDPEPRLDDLIDRVVDGGLSATQLHEVVARLEVSEDGWRRCALAFIEAQALGQILREMDTECPSTRDVIRLRPRAIKVRRFAYAASLAVLAFGLGWIGHGTSGKGRMEVAGLSRSEADDDGPLPVPGERVRAAGVRGPDPDRTGIQTPHPASPPSPRVQGEGRLAQVVHESGAVPVADLSNPAEPEQFGTSLEDWLRDQPPPISSYEQAALEREGYRVEQHREVVIGTLDDGRLAAVPIDQVQVEYVGHLPL